MNEEKSKNIVRRIQAMFCGASVEEKIFQGIKVGYKVGQEDLYNHYFKGIKDPVIIERKGSASLSPNTHQKEKEVN